MESKRIIVLLIEDNKFDQMAFERMVEEQNLSYDYTIAGCISEATKILYSKKFDVIITDYYLGDGTVFDIMDLIIDVPIIMTTGAGDEDIAVKAMKEGAYDYLTKDIHHNYLKVLPVVVENAIKHKKAEEQFRMLSHAVMNINDSIYITDMQDKIIFVNKAFCRTYGYQDDEILEKPSTVLWNEESIKNMKSILSNIDEYGWKGELYHKRKDGNEFPISLARSIIKDDDGNEIAVVGVAHDMTERKRVEEELRKAKEAAEAGARVKTEFLANISHEIRTPLNAVIGMTEFMLETELNAEQLDYLKVVQSSSDILLTVIDDVLDFSKIEAGQMELEETSFNLRNIVEQVADIFSIRAESKGLELMCYIEPNIPGWLKGDPNRLGQILINLVGNAIKFTENGEVVIECRFWNGQSEERRAKSEKRNPKSQIPNPKSVQLYFAVRDSGIGITKENQNQIFGKFCQADSSMSRKFGGTGLGLSICNSLVEMMGGRISLESKPGHGSTFHFSLEFPTAHEPLKEKIEYTYSDFENISILVVDDNHTNLFILKKTLRAWGFKVRNATNGAEALSILRNRDANFDLVILDHQMPEMDGIELARRIRSEAKINDVKIIMLSSWGGISTQLKQELDIARSITKPVKQSKLLDILVHELRAQIGKGTEAVKRVKSRQAPRLAQHHKILVVEDNVDNQNLAKKMLEKASYGVDIADNGQMAVEATKKTRYDLILMDIQMPVMDGFEATKQIRALERNLHQERVPIIAVTAHALEGYHEKCLMHDMDDYISKPLKKKILLETIKKWLDTRPAVMVVDESVDNRSLIGN